MRMRCSSGATMVDSSPSLVGPASSIIRTLPPRLANTCSARVGLIDPLALADGAARGLPLSRIRLSIAGWAGMRSAMVARPPVTRGAMLLSARSGRTIVSGPGQNAFANMSAVRFNVAIRSAMPRSATWTISGLNPGRPFAAKIAATARSSVASAARPYTVSVGTATGSPARISVAASRSAAVSYRHMRVVK